MSAALEKSLDEIIGENPKQHGSNRRNGGSGGPARRRETGGPRRSGGGSGGGGGRDRNPGRIASTPYSRDSGPRRRSRSRSGSPQRWQHDRADSGRRGVSRDRGGRGGGTIVVTNLQYEIDESQVEHIFDAVGRITRVNLVSDRAGRSTGKCYVDYERRNDALEAVRQFDTRLCGGQRLQVELITLPQKNNDLGSRLRFDSDNYERPGRGQSGRGGDSRQGGERGGRGDRRGGRKDAAAAGAGGSGKRVRRGPATAEQLDAELDAYLNAKTPSHSEGVAGGDAPAGGDADGMQVD
ncbi:hypothetical protein BCR37DRAFT_378010 [Protomyces lactucae-debilis]|uniref:RRM domain-containing protein n=1 Tax=Protomyces lactucae-debilis TaxID=2754530 RepID=A0A1Y2FM28_PROLT|nr:uncharacterized protein BCR37DRAFT_378010 [Protomyces lactucae-debilis]ORY85031.1 hypothetical protein BCR37DRAFT_378010 [Protomyces lactucae-debilis]